MAGDKPAVIEDYNKNMGFVDQIDKNARLVDYPHRYLKWPHVILFWLVNASIVNAWVIWKSENNSTAR